MQIGSFPRIRLGHGPTPLEPMPRLSTAAGGAVLWVKRDDCTGLATGGNKTRKLEFLVADAVAQGADTLITQGATQSNHVRQTAAAAARLGLRCEVALEARVAQAPDLYRRNGNVLLDNLLGARIHNYPAGTDMNAAMAEIAETVRRQGGAPYVIPGGGSNPVGALGYVVCALEILQQAADLGIKIDAVVHATGSAGTQAGLIVGFESAQSGVEVLGVSVGKPRETQEALVQTLVEQTARHVGLIHPIGRERVTVDSGYIGEGYGVPTPGMIDAVRQAARLEGLLLDPVYSGKAMDGLLDYCRKGRFPARRNVVFIHTGGQAGLFAYEPTFGA